MAKKGPSRALELEALLAALKMASDEVIEGTGPRFTMSEWVYITGCNPGTSGYVATHFESERLYLVGDAMRAVEAIIDARRRREKAA